MKNKIYSHIPAIMFGVLVISFLAAFYVLAWTEPSVAPPGGNVPAPLNVSINAQSKEGALVVGTNSAVTTGLIVQYGNVGIGTTGPGAKLDVQAGTVGILVADARSNAGTLQIAYNDAGTYGFLQSADATTYRNLALNPSGGNVGIGTTAPSEKLDVDGQIHATGDICTDQAGGVCLGTLVKFDPNFTTIASSYQLLSGSNNNGTPPINGWQTVSTIAFTGGIPARAIIARAIGVETKIYIRTKGSALNITDLKTKIITPEDKQDGGASDTLVIPLDVNGEFEWYLEKTDPPTYQAYIYLHGWYE